MTGAQSLGQEGPLEEEMETHSCMLAWRIPWTEEPGRLEPMESQRVGHNWVTNYLSFFSTMKGDNVLSRYKIKGTDQILIFSFESYERTVNQEKIYSNTETWS